MRVQSYDFSCSLARFAAFEIEFAAYENRFAASVYREKAAWPEVGASRPCRYGWVCAARGA
ncbi:MAG TPA: hypothetical protein DEQ84_02575 [Prevotellaceae bacterium]|nr:hypothetical protein [Prevotellaceae bacterium]